MSMERARQENIGGDGPQAAAARRPSAPPMRRRWSLVAWGVGGAFVAWLLMLSYPFFVYAMAATNSSAPGPPSEKDLAMIKLYKYRNVLTGSSLAAAILATSLACGMAISSRSARVVVIAIAGGIVLGGGFGAGAGWLAQQSFDWPALLYLGDLLRILVLQAVLWAIVGLGVGLAVGLPAWRWQLLLRLIPIAIGGGLAAAIAYPLVWAVAGILVPRAEGDQLIADSSFQRLVWLSTAGTCIGAALAWLGPETPNDSSK